MLYIAGEMRLISFSTHKMYINHLQICFMGERNCDLQQAKVKSHEELMEISENL